MGGGISKPKSPPRSGHGVGAGLNSIKLIGPLVIPQKNVNKKPPPRSGHGVGAGLNSIKLIGPLVIPQKNVNIKPLDNPIIEKYKKLANEILKLEKKIKKETNNAKLAAYKSKLSKLQSEEKNLWKKK